MAAIPRHSPARCQRIRFVDLFASQFCVSVFARYRPWQASGAPFDGNACRTGRKYHGTSHRFQRGARTTGSHNQNIACWQFLSRECQTACTMARGGLRLLSGATIVLLSRLLSAHNPQQQCGRDTRLVPGLHV